MKCDRCKKNKYLYFQHVAGVVICEECYSKLNQNWFRTERWRDLELMYDGPEDDEQYEYYLDILDMIPNEDIEFEIDLDEEDEEEEPKEKKKK